MDVRTQRTQDIIDYYRGLPSEWGLLKGVLLLDIAVSRAAETRGGYALGRAEREAVIALIDPMMIAARMDQIDR